MLVAVVVTTAAMVVAAAPQVMVGVVEVATPLQMPWAMYTSRADETACCTLKSMH
jgi:hypothetical protein